ncbi:DNA gyrase inhibitor YacG [Acinetobacter genomosp. 15BJ]|uniref:DNA gyrase inhibitor YacG n=1 Tax=Acinetobacter genomosp. 15BJ TaxID=106651 RepID=A0ABT8UV28_9GAMM|nr:DNA gyrase inhibitor YacG [Acinetobacter genomosp. 15BJ]MDO3655846.1 DNA gyrase inhibitor YacG [Acinetobacter genomosp. 15BJ]
MPRTFPCPRCGEASTWEGNQFRPFCSERCKLIDLGAWASDEYKLPTQDAPKADQKRNEDDYED